MRMRGMLTALLWMIACGPTVREVKTAEGERAFEVSCEGDGAKCASAAKDQCPDGFGVIAESSTTEGPHLMTFRCQRNGDPFASRPAEEKSSSGPSVGQAIGAALAGAAQGFNDGVSRSRPPHAPPPSSPASSDAPIAAPEQRASRHCSSDYDCSTGEVCSKPAGMLTGECARAVNEFGTPTMPPPRVDSIGPGQRQCRWATECGIGFECDQGRCIKR